MNISQKKKKATEHQQLCEKYLFIICADKNDVRKK